jgi:hypothetical protein
VLQHETRGDISLTGQNTHLRAIVNQDGAAILDTKSGRISTLNSIGAVVWQSLEGGDDAEAIAAELAQMTGEPFDAVKRDVIDFIEALKAQDLLPS